MKSLLSELFITRHPLWTERAFEDDLIAIHFIQFAKGFNSIFKRPPRGAISLSAFLGGNAECSMTFVSEWI